MNIAVVKMETIEKIFAFSLVSKNVKYVNIMINVVIF